MVHMMWVAMTNNMYTHIMFVIPHILFSMTTSLTYNYIITHSYINVIYTPTANASPQMTRRKVTMNPLMMKRRINPPNLPMMRMKRSLNPNPKVMMTRPLLPRRRVKRQQLPTRRVPRRRQRLQQVDLPKLKVPPPKRNQPLLTPNVLPNQQPNVPHIRHCQHWPRTYYHRVNNPDCHH